MTRGQKRGLSLGGVLLLSAILSVLALGLCRLSVAHLWLSANSNSGLEASALANSAASAAMARILENRDYGPSDPDIIVETSKGRAIVTFSQERAELEGIPHSTNNLNETVPKEGSLNSLVAPATVHVVASATAGGSRRTVEAVLRLPPFPWAIVSGGTLETREGVMVGALPEGQWPPPPDNELLPADLLANSFDDRAVVLGEGSTVLGDVESPGQVVLDGDEVTVRGEVRSGVAPVQVPQLDPRDYDPVTMGLDFEELGGEIDSTSVLPLTGAVRRSENLEVAGLEMNGTHLFIDGDLTVRGAITGTGVLICTGDIDIQDVTLHGATELAIVADGSVNLRGGGRAGSLVRGLFYAGDSFTARDITLAGVLITGRANAGVELENARILAEEVAPTTLTTTGIEPATYRVGGLNADDMPRGLRIMSDFSNLNAPSRLDPMFEPLFLLGVAPTEGGFPVTLTLTAGAVPTLSFPTRTLRDPDDVEQYIEDLRTYLLSQLPASGYMTSSVQAMLGVLAQSLLLALDGSGAGSSGGNVAISLTGDLSRFLPFEDRVRVTSWFER